MTKLTKFIFSTAFLKQLILLLIASIAFVLLLFFWFRIYTRHGESLTLNDLSELTLDQATEVLESKGLRYTIVDSTSYSEEYLPMAVIQQDPIPQSKVKKGRTIYLWLNAGSPPEKAVPCLMNNASIDDAYERLPQVGFKVGEVFYKPMDNLKEGNPILKLMIDSAEVTCGDKATYGTIIDLVVGEKAGANKVDVPMLLGMTLLEAEFKLNNDLNFGTIIYDTIGLIDSATAVIYKQLPDISDEPVRIGSTVDVWVTQDLPEDVFERIQAIENDTIQMFNDEE